MYTINKEIFSIAFLIRMGFILWLFVELLQLFNNSLLIVCIKSIELSTSNIFIISKCNFVLSNRESPLLFTKIIEILSKKIVLPYKLGLKRHHVRRSLCLYMNSMAQKLAIEKNDVMTKERWAAKWAYSKQASSLRHATSAIIHVASTARNAQQTKTTSINLQIDLNPVYWALRTTNTG